MGRSPLHIAAERGRADFVNILLQNGAKASRFARDSETALHSTIRGASEGHCEEAAALECVRILCKHHHIIDIQDKQKQTPIYLAVKHGFWSIVSELIIAGASIDYNHQNTTIRQLVEKEKPELVEHVPQTEPIITIYQLGFGLLTSENDEEFVKYLDKFDLEANINERWYLGHTVLQVAVRHNLINSVTKLLDVGADPNIYSDFGWNALHIAVEVNSRPLCELLLQNGSHVDAKTAFRSETALHLAAKRNQVPIFTLLDHEIITEYLDKRIASRRTDNIQDSGSIIFDYSFLIPEPIPDDGLQHPVLRSFLFLKWFRVYWLFYLQLVIYAVFVTILTIGVYLDTHIQRTGHEHEDHIPRHRQ
ncbi:hypothetical protein B566_EDAN012395 [Ephemera danica]|nr:hypothetical protein B566_EDAN012395 [Ephemera danica]